MVKAGASCQSFNERMNFVTFKLVGILGEGARGGPASGASTNPTSSVPLCIYAFDTD